MSRRLLLIPTGVGSGGGGGFDPTQYYTRDQIDAMVADFVTASTNSLINYYLKSETYSQSEVNSLISAIETTHFEVYASLSDITNPQSNVLYLVGPIGNGSDKYEIYIYSNNQFVKIDDTSIDLSGYATTTDLQNAINTAMATLQQYAVDNFYQKSEVDAMIAQVQTLQGIQGVKGTDGVDGQQGIQGIKGIDGINGEQGIQGASGASIQGSQGIQGISGQNGTNGIQGIQGIKGTDGTNGIQGIQGIRGDDGKNGNDGLQGIQGIQGASGGGGVETVELTELTESELGELYEIVVNSNPVSPDTYLAEHRLVANGMPVTSWGDAAYTINASNELVEDDEGEIGAAFYTDTNIVKEAETPDTISAHWYCIFAQEDGGNYTYVLDDGINTYENSGGGASRYDISTKSQAELADFYQNWQTIMASNDVYFGVYPVTAVIPDYTVQGYTALLVEYNTSFALETDATTQTSVVKGNVEAHYILPNGMNGKYGTTVTMPSKGYVDAVVAGIQAIQGIQGTAGTNGANGLQGIQGIQGASGGGASKIELTTLPMQDLLQFYQDTLAGTMRDFSQYTAGGYPLINAYKMNAGWEVELPSALGGGTYTTDGTEVAIVMNQKVNAVGSQWNETQRNLYTYITLFSPTIYQTYGQTIDTDIRIGYDQVAQLQFVLADDSIVNYTMPLSQW